VNNDYPELCLTPLEFVEFMKLCSDSGLVDSETARRINDLARALGGVGVVPRFSPVEITDPADFTEVLRTPRDPEMLFSSFAVSEDNTFAFEITRTLALVPRSWIVLSPLFLCAPSGRGKTHLLASISAASSRANLHINTIDLLTTFQHASSCGLTLMLSEWIDSFEILLLDDFQNCAGESFQQFIVSVLDRFHDENRAVVLAADVPPDEIPGINATLLSRIKAGLVYTVGPVDISGKKTVINSVFAAAGLTVPEPVVRKAAEMVNGNMRLVKAAARRLLAYELASGKVPEVEKVPELLNESGFGVTPRRTPEAPVPAPKQTEARQVAGKPRKPAAPDKAGRYKQMVSAAGSVEEQSSALEMALEERIAGLEAKGADSFEIARFKMALTFLRAGKLEAAMLCLRN
jgi:hypothetical protein